MGYPAHPALLSSLHAQKLPSGGPMSFRATRTRRVEDSFCLSDVTLIALRAYDRIELGHANRRLLLGQMCLLLAAPASK